jgi:hypothetical protein
MQDRSIENIQLETEKKLNIQKNITDMWDTTISSYIILEE